MAINIVKVTNWPFELIHQSYTKDQTILYALGLGVGGDPLDANQLQHVYEKNLKALPTMGVILGFPGLWLNDPSSGIDYSKVVHGEQHIEMLKPLPPEGDIISVNKVEKLIDKGPGKGALILVSREIRGKVDDDLICRQLSVIFARGDGGFGGEGGVPPPIDDVPGAKPDVEFDWKTSPGQALIYRRSGDLNPLHADPEVAARAGFDRPILHGLASFGIAGFAAIQVLCAGVPERLRAVRARFSAPVYPGETLRMAFWYRNEGSAAFQMRSVERDAIVINRGHVSFATP